MSSSNILLILISGFGVIHGLFLAIFLWVYKNGDLTSNRILSMLLLVLSFRIGKSVFLEFSEGLSINWIFTGLATLMAIGPLFYIYTLALREEGFKFKSAHWWHFVPATLGIIFGLLLNDSNKSVIPKWIFALLFLIYYLHYLIYLIYSYRSIKKGRKLGLDDNSYDLLRLLFFSLLVIWGAYVLNLFDEIIPYVYGPILYTFVAYAVSFMVIKKGYIHLVKQKKYKTTPVPDDQINELFDKVLEFMEGSKEYKNNDISLKGLAQRLKVTPQVLSMAVNKKAMTNFNNFINNLRIEEAKRLFEDKKYANYTIASIAYDIGFNSISSFNGAFKRQVGCTPKAYRQSLPE